MDNTIHDNFTYIISYISPRIQMYLKKLSSAMVENIQEIRLRAERPIVIVTPSGNSFLTLSGKTSYIYSANCVTPTENEIIDTITKMCEYSMHSHYEDILNGYVTLPNGSRVGVCGTAVYERDVVKGIKNINSINIRIPREVQGVSNIIFDSVYNGVLKNLLVVGPPSSGKTTMLRDLAFQLSSGRMGKYYKICVIDERKEIFPSKQNIKTLGPNTDVLLGFPKGKAISMAVRTLSPDVIICDEIGNVEEANEVLNGVNCGIKFALSMHASNVFELKNKKIFLDFCNACVLEKVLFLEGSEKPCKVKSVIDVEEVFDEDFSNSFYNSNMYSNFNKICSSN